MRRGSAAQEGGGTLTLVAGQRSLLACSDTVRRGESAPEGLRPIAAPCARRALLAALARLYFVAEGPQARLEPPATARSGNAERALDESCDLADVVFGEGVRLTHIACFPSVFDQADDQLGGEV